MKLTQTFAVRVKPPQTGYEIHWDGSIGGFGLCVTCNGAKSFILNYRIHGRQRRFTIGSLGEFTAETARARAIELRQQIRNGDDPFALLEQKGREAREAEARQRTLGDLASYYLSNHAEIHKRPRSVAEDKAMLDSIILPRLGRILASNVTHRDVSDLHASLKPTPYRANRTLALLHKMFNLAATDTRDEWGVTGNPAAGIPRFHEEKRERWLSEEELQRLATALDAYPRRHDRRKDIPQKQREWLRAEAQREMDALRLLLLTGSRKGEVLQAKWTEFDLAPDRGIWNKPSAHTKQKRVEHVPLNAQALALVRGIPRDGEYLFPGRQCGHLQDLKNCWKHVCKLAKLEGLRIHDLRHNFASHLVSSGVSLPVLGRLLGHTQPQTTARYGHLADDPMRAATNKFPLLPVPRMVQ